MNAVTDAMTVPRQESRELGDCRADHARTQRFRWEIFTATAKFPAADPRSLVRSPTSATPPRDLRLVRVSRST